MTNATTPETLPVELSKKQTLSCHKHAVRTLPYMEQILKQDPTCELAQAEVDSYKDLIAQLRSNLIAMGFTEEYLDSGAVT